MQFGCRFIQIEMYRADILIIVVYELHLNYFGKFHPGARQQAGAVAGGGARPSVERAGRA
jgi:hypothetical protein